jgi:hypothetical protein
MLTEETRYRRQQTQNAMTANMNNETALLMAYYWLMKKGCLAQTTKYYHGRAGATENAVSAANDELRNK